jgi:hypothetical protein
VGIPKITAEKSRYFSVEFRMKNVPDTGRQTLRDLRNTVVSAKNDLETSCNALYPENRKKNQHSCIALFL